jgi:ubiquinone/menaquinone biosynthesis C-methylase UbiE
MDSSTLIEQTFAPLAGKRLLDIGCGGGALVKALAAKGALATGVDPAAVGIDPSLIRASAESLPFADRAFDGVIFQNSLHHVPEHLMNTALAEAARVVGEGRSVLVIEPLAEGSFFAALLPIEDETTVRSAAQLAIRHAIDSGVARLFTKHDWLRETTFDSIDPFLAMVCAADASRAEVIDADRAKIIAAFEAAAERTASGGYRLVQPIRAHVLTATRAPGHG